MKKSEIMKNEKSTFSVLFYLKKDKMKEWFSTHSCPYHNQRQTNPIQYQVRSL